MAKVNVVIPVYNQEEYIAQTLNSVFAQTYRNFDVTVIDDGSTDNSLVVAKAGAVMSGCHVRIISRENRGLSESRNEGIASGDGQFILPLDADDWIEPRYLERTIYGMTDSQVGIVSTDMQYEGLKSNRISPKGLTLEIQKYSNNLPVCSLIRRKAFEQTPGYRTIFVDTPDGRVVGYEDWCLWLDILKRGWQVSVVNEPLFHYRLKPVSMITKATTYRKELTAVVHSMHPDLFGGAQ